MASKEFLTTGDAELCIRILRAHEEQGKERGNECLHDPLEQDPQFADVIAEARASAEARLWEIMPAIDGRPAGPEDAASPELRSLGNCHWVWMQMKEDLRSKGLTWYSPAEMNPGSVFD